MKAPVALLLLLGLGLCSVALADPPPWAPAHGYRGHHHGDDDNEESRPTVVYQDIPLSEGRCNRDAIGTVIGGVSGAVIGGQIGKNNGNQQAGVILGAIAGAIIGHQVGEAMDEADRQCSVQVFEQARDGQRIVWRNPDNGNEYRMTPVSTFVRNGHTCRNVESVVMNGGRSEKTTRQVCQVSDGSWKISGR